MTLETLRRDKKEGILQAARKYGARNIRVFLSALQELLDTEVDVATERMLKPNIRERALRDAIPL